MVCSAAIRVPATLGHWQRWLLYASILTSGGKVTHQHTRLRLPLRLVSVLGMELNSNREVGRVKVKLGYLKFLK